MIEELENRFNIRYPQKTKATYTSLLNYSKDLDTSLQRWYRYKEGYSIELVKNIINKYMFNEIIATSMYTLIISLLFLKHYIT